MKKEDWIVELTESSSDMWSSDIDCNSREDAIREGMKGAIEDGLDSFRIGKVESCDIPTIYASSIIENAQEQLYDDVGDASDTYLDSVTKEQEEELEIELNEVFYRWHKKHKLSPSCYMVSNIEAIKVNSES